MNRRNAVAALIMTPVALGGVAAFAKDDKKNEGTATPQATASPMASPTAGKTVEVHALDTFKFEPSEFEISKAGTIKLVNKGFLEHDFEVDAWEGKEMEKPILAGQEAEIKISKDAKVGETYDFYCTIPGHKEGGMTGKVKITE